MLVNALAVSTSGLRHYSYPFTISHGTSQPIVLGDTATLAGETGEIIVNAKPTYFRTGANFASVNTSTTPGTDDGEIRRSNATGKLVKWNQTS